MKNKNYQLFIAIIVLVTTLLLFSCEHKKNGKIIINETEFYIIGVKLEKMFDLKTYYYYKYYLSNSKYSNDTVIVIKDLKNKTDYIPRQLYIIGDKLKLIKE